MHPVSSVPEECQVARGSGSSSSGSCVKVEVEVAIDTQFVSDHLVDVTLQTSG